MGMTTKEAIEAIKCNWPDSRYTILREALDMAISALRQQETVTNRYGLNEPLTLDELRSAYKLGCPVWLVGMEDGDGWVFIHHVDSCSVRYARIGTSEEWCFRTKSYGVRVWAYRQKPEEGIDR